MENKKLNFPMCGKKISVNSVRRHVSGKVRYYWECKDCNINVMHRGKD